MTDKADTLSEETLEELEHLEGFRSDGKILPAQALLLARHAHALLSEAKAAREMRETLKRAHEIIRRHLQFRQSLYRDPPTPDEIKYTKFIDEELAKIDTALTPTPDREET